MFCMKYVHDCSCSFKYFPSSLGWYWGCWSWTFQFWWDRGGQNLNLHRFSDNSLQHVFYSLCFGMSKPNFATCFIYLYYSWFGEPYGETIYCTFLWTPHASCQKNNTQRFSMAKSQFSGQNLVSNWQTKFGLQLGGQGKQKVIAQKCGMRFHLCFATKYLRFFVGFGRVVESARFIVELKKAENNDVCFKVKRVMETGEAQLTHPKMSIHQEFQEFFQQNPMNFP